MVDRKMPRIQEVLLPHFREQLPDMMFTSWVPPIDMRRYPLVNVRRLGGLPKDPQRLDKPVIELTVYGDVDLGHTEDAYMDVRHVLYEMWKRQVVTPKGYVSSYFETMGPTQFDSPYDDTWRVQGLIQLGLRPRRN